MINWKPKSDMQKAVLQSGAMIVCAGGSAGTYKSETLLVDAVQEYDNPNFHGILFRESIPELNRALIPRAHAIYSQMGAVYNSQDRSFRWPWGAMMRFGYLARDEDVYAHQGPRYSWVGFDESTHMTEFRIRYLLSRLASTDPILHCRIRLATNPGGPGHAWHHHVFLGNRCPHCETGGRRAGRIYQDATWLSDKLPIGMSTQYIFGKWDPNGLLPNYDKQLRTQGGAFAKQLLDGCWRTFEGQYFDIWQPTRPGTPMVVPRQSIRDDWWWTFWSGTDYGFSGSAAFSVLLCRSPEGGPIYVLDEFPHDLTQARKIDVKTFAREHYKALIKMPMRYEQPQRTAAMYLSPDCWAERGDQNTLAHLANQELEPYELEFQRARTDRAGGAQLIYTMLRAGELVIADTCQNVIRAIESRVHDKKEPLKVEKVIGDPYDDVYDSLRYAVYSHLEPEDKPLGMRVQDRINAIAMGDEKRGAPPDPTRAAFEYERILREEREENGDEPSYLGGNARRRIAQAMRRRRRF
jgi:hypothetical protein